MNFIREYHVPSEYSLFDFKQFIGADMGFDDSQQSVFFVLDRNSKKTESYSVFDMDMVSLEDLCKKGVERLLYTFDFFNDRSLFIEFQGETEEQSRVYYPVVVQSIGDAPNQFFEKIGNDINKKRSINDYDNDEKDDDEEDNEEIYDYL
jgi:hypothetical protein